MALRSKQLAFIDAYLSHWNATKAAIDAGYSERSAYSIGSENLRKPEIQAAIAARLDALKMSADEVLTRLTQQARGSMAPFIRRDADGDLYGFDLSDTQPLHLLKKASVTRRRQKDDHDEIVTVETVTIELYDAQAALQLLGRHHKLFVDRTELTGKDGNPIEVNDARSRLSDLLTKRAAASHAERDPGADSDAG
jgi:phage terminase small subunit